MKSNFKSCSPELESAKDALDDALNLADGVLRDIGTGANIKKKNRSWQFI